MILRLAADTMGTRVEFVLAGDDEFALRGAGDAAIEEIETLNDRLSRFRSDSLVSHINRTAHERPVRLDRPTFDLLALARDVWEASGGAFDVTMGAVMTHLGLHDAGDAPSRPAWGMDAVTLDPATLSVAFTRPGLQIDLGGIAKGHALDVAAQMLRDAGVHAALLHAGASSVVAIGSPDDQPDGWRIALGPPGSGAPIVRLRDAALSVSAPHGRTAEHEGKVVTHILDPRTGAPTAAGGGARLAAVVGPKGSLTEAWSTALVVLNHRPPAPRMPGNLVSIIHTPPQTPAAPDIPHPSNAWRIEGQDADAVVIHPLPSP